ncbi:carbonic anhydrase 2-like [Chironomus tepperi]|uniref:carbonic anhydrase 2-like n=1 Tax=Chironomus tepperi TaxID=113505 RepID=UPI00391F1CB2
MDLKVMNKMFLLILLTIKLTNSMPLPVEDDAELEVDTTPAPVQGDKPHYHFSYNDRHEDGPSNWPELCSTGMKQSPIAYDQAKYEKKVVRPTIVMSGAYQIRPEKVHLINNGHGVTVSFRFANDTKPKITGGPLGKEVYIFASFHYHTPCEHQFVLNSKSCALEIHMVHFNEKYGTLENSTDKSDGLAVLGILYLSTYTQYLQSLPFMPMIKNIIEPNTEYYEEDPGKVFSYYDVVHLMSVPRVVSYKGSLTTPVCSEAVTWVILASPNLVLESDMRQIREIQDSDGNKILRNNRPTQPLNGRKVFLYAAF